MSLWNVQDILIATQGDLVHSVLQTCDSVVMDSREIQKGSLFLCMPGTTFDGHDFIHSAYEKGAHIILGSKKEALLSLQNVTTIHVPDVLAALKKMALFRRLQIKGKVASITGSFGKTSTKEWIAQICSHYGKTFATQKSYNSFPGVPFTLANMPVDVDFGIVEIGMNHPGEIAPLAQICQADIAVITTIGTAHIEYMKNKETIAEEKSDIFLGIKEGTVIYPQDQNTTPILEAKAIKQNIKKSIGFGHSEQSIVRIVSSTSLDLSTRVMLRYQGQDYTYTISLIGEHWVLNSACVFSTCLALGLTPQQIIKVICDFRGVPGRGVQHLIALKTGGYIRILNDCYNAGTESMRAAIHTLSLTPAPEKEGRKIAVLGDMYEQGNVSGINHRNIANLLIENGIHKVYGSGPAMKHMFDALPEFMKASYDPDSDAQNIAKTVVANTQPGDVILIKGSRGSKISRGRMSVVVDALLSLGKETQVNQEDLKANAI